ncbi:MAG: acyl-CoA thioesterase [Fidelibacterota bacterium]
MIQYEYQTKVYYKDVDQMGIVYYTRYLEYFEAARTELLNGLGMSVTTMEESGYHLPVVTCHCEYKGSARFEDELIVRTSIKSLPKSRLRIDYQVYRPGGRQPLVTGYTLHAFTNRNGIPGRPPKKLLTILKKAL